MPLFPTGTGIGTVIHYIWLKIYCPQKRFNTIKTTMYITHNQLNSDSYLHYGANYKPPLAMLNLMPKSASGPPGLCDAVSMMPPSVLYLRITHDTAGVDIMPFCATITFDTYDICTISTLLTRYIPVEVAI